MKSKRFNKKLSLNKATISNLTNIQLNVARGGTTSPPTCEVTCAESCECTKLIILCNTRTLFCGC